MVLGALRESMMTATFKMDNQQDLLYSTGNSAQCMWQPGWEGSLGENGTCMCVSESLCCSPETFTTLLIVYVCVQSLGCARLLRPHGL